MNYIIIDLEFNQAFQFHNGKKTQVVDECPFEIIQIGAVKLDSELNIKKTADFLIKPQLYTVLHPYVEKLTEIKIEMLNEQPYFSEVFESFINFIYSDGDADDEYVFCTWGGADIVALFKNAIYYRLDTDKITGRYINVQEMAAKKLERQKGLNIGLKSAVAEFKLEDDMSFHYALNDAIYTAKIFQLIFDTDFQIKSYVPGTEEAPSVKRGVCDANRLYRVVEKEYGRRLTKKEKRIIQKVYFMGRTKQFDVK